MSPGPAPLSFPSAFFPPGFSSGKQILVVDFFILEREESESQDEEEEAEQQGPTFTIVSGIGRIALRVELDLADEVRVFNKGLCHFREKKAKTDPRFPSFFM